MSMSIVAAFETSAGIAVSFFYGRFRPTQDAYIRFR